MSYSMLGILAFILVIGSRPSAVSCIFVANGCQDLLESFGEVTANFTRCTIRNARPITVCLACVDTFIEVLTKYQQILALHGEDGTPCKLQLINVDKLEVVEGSYRFVINQWNRADCNNCFQNQSGSITPEANYYTIGIREKSDQLEACISNNANGTDPSNKTSGNPKVCFNCASDYKALNDYYIVNKSLVNGFCMDITDMINTTRYRWSQEFRCCSEREQPERIFLLVTMTFCIIPLIFYLFVRLCTVKHLLPISTPKRWEHYISSSSSTANLVQS
nr:PREDICTED: osteopetrosis-associated transmembrane protein 1 [Bemisia tabaci]